MDCSAFSVTLKDSTSSSNRILSLTEFVVAFGKYTSHFYTYHKLFSAKCATQVAQWNQCPYWGALDFDIYNRVFLGCRVMPDPESVPGPSGIETPPSGSGSGRIGPLSAPEPDEYTDPETRIPSQEALNEMTYSVGQLLGWLVYSDDKGIPEVKRF
ncbi:poly [Labeo rohita]|uniref:Poly n=1 Tax=Labeo rohita TaxID=84645 RepID=A0A498P208_LABRO|nr:poly [Labeo rohita]